MKRPCQLPTIVALSFSIRSFVPYFLPSTAFISNHSVLETNFSFQITVFNFFFQFLIPISLSHTLSLKKHNWPLFLNLRIRLQFSVFAPRSVTFFHFIFMPIYITLLHLICGYSLNSTNEIS